MCQPASQKDKNPVREISAWKVTDAVAAGYCFCARFLAGPLLNITSLNCFTYIIKFLGITRKSLEFFWKHHPHFLFSKAVPKKEKQQELATKIKANQSESLAQAKL